VNGGDEREVMCGEVKWRMFGVVNEGKERVEV